MTITITAQAGYLGNPARSLITATGIDPGARYRLYRAAAPLPRERYPLSQSLAAVRFVMDGEHGNTWNLEESKDLGATWSAPASGAVSVAIPAAPAERILTAEWGALYPGEAGYSEAHLALTGLSAGADYMLYLQGDSASSSPGMAKTQWVQTSAAEGRRYLRIIMGESEMGYARFRLYKRNLTTGAYDYLNVEAILRPYVEVRRFASSPDDIVIYASHMRPGVAHTLRYGSIHPSVGLFPVLATSFPTVTPTGTEYRWESAKQLLADLLPPSGPLTLDPDHRTAWGVGIGTQSAIAYLSPNTLDAAGSQDSVTGLSVRATANTAALHVEATITGVGASNWWWLVRRTATDRRVVSVAQGPPAAAVLDITAPMDTPISYEVWEFSTTRPTEASVPSKIKASNRVVLASGIAPAFATDTGQWAVLRTADGTMVLRAGLADVAWSHAQRTQTVPIAGAKYPAVASDIPLAESGDLLLITPDIASRTLLLRMLESSQVLFLRAPCVPGVDSLWVKVTGSVEEKPAERSVPAARAWQIPIQTLPEPVMVSQPFGALQ